MKRMKKNQQKSRGIENYCFLNQKSENHASSSIRSQAPNENNSDPESFDSPYKNSLSEIKQITLNNDGADDFRTPKPIKIVPKRVHKVQDISKKSTAKRTIKRTRRKVTNSIEKYTTNNFLNLDVNPEHLQMALALSKSTLAEENPEEYEKIKEQDFPVFLTPEKIPKVGTILERYGFRLNKNRKFQTELSVSNPKEAKILKCSKFRFVTPTLHSRTNEEREALITAKISLIISQGIQPYSECQNDHQGILKSDILQQYNCPENHIFNINVMAMDELKMFCYYCTSLKVPPSQSVYGCLLRNWDEIPGREKSPKRSCVVNDSDSRDLKKDVIERQKNCPSPDLFDSDNDSSFLKTSETIVRPSSSLLNITPPKSSASLSSHMQNEGGFSRNLSVSFGGKNGIEYFESFNTDSENLSKEVFCLKRSEESGFQETSEDEPVYLIQSSSSNGSCSLEKIQSQSNREECEENIDEVGQIQQTCESTFKESFSVLKNTQVTEEPRAIVDDDLFDLTQYSPQCNKSDLGYNSNQLSSNMENNLVNATENMNQKKMLTVDGTSLCLVAEDKLTNLAEIMDLRSTFSNDNVVLDKYLVRSSEESKISSDDTIRRLSSWSDRKSNEYNSSKSLNVTDYITQMLNSQPDQGINENNSDHSTQASCSQETIVISDEELNYSSIHSREQKNDDFYNLSDIDEIVSNKNKDKIDEDEIDNIHSNLRNKYGSQSSSQQSPEKVQFSQHSETKDTNADQGIKYVTPQKIEKTTEPVFHKEITKTANTNTTNDVSTPDNNILIKTTDVTPMVDYDQMDTPTIRRELDKFGFKPLKRPRAVKLLKYVYETTHPFVNSRSRTSPDQENSTSSSDQEDNRAVKRRRTFELGDEFLGVEDLVFERKISTKVAACRIPLQIAWYNFVSENPQLQENILLYEPIQLEVVHAMLKEQSGCKYHLEDMISFLDKKCITFRTTQSQGPRTKKII